MSGVTPQLLRAEFEKLVGQAALRDRLPATRACDLLSPGGAGLGYSQLNELLILLGLDRVSRSFFQYLVNGTTDYDPSACIPSFAEFQEGVDRFRKVALLYFGNVKFGFKTLSRDANEALLTRDVQLLGPVDDDVFHMRHEPIRAIEPIPADKTYFLGYLVEQELQQRLRQDPNDVDALDEEKERLQVVEQGRRNHEAYLASDHLDVYVATSMRERHEFAIVSRLTEEIFGHPLLVDLKLRWFDPTQAYCPNRMDKGLAEALMLRRADCTIYLAQESDTLGKDSELASTLAQGKPVIAFVPEVVDGFAERLLSDLRVLYPEQGEAALLLAQLRLFEPRASWTDSSVRRWVDDPAAMDIGVATGRLQDAIASHYNKRANTLKTAHPLGIQMNLATGVANGVLVVRTVGDCAELVRRIVTRTLEFDLEDEDNGTMLKERISGCVFRLMTSDALLTNSFWNYYLSS